MFLNSNAAVIDIQILQRRFDDTGSNQILLGGIKSLYLGVVTTL